GPGVLGTPGGDDISPRIHGDSQGRLRLAAGGSGGAVEDSLPQRHAAGPGELDHGEVEAGAGVLGKAGGHDIPTPIHGDGPRLVIAIRGAIAHLTPELYPRTARKLDDGEVVAGRVLDEACGRDIARRIHGDRERLTIAIRAGAADGFPPERKSGRPGELYDG